MNNKIIRLLNGALFLLVVCTPHSANADLGQRGSVKLELVGSIEPRCELSNLDGTEANFSTKEAQTIGFDVYCNMEMSITISARNGALTNEAAVDRNGAKEEYLRNYSVELELDAFDFSRKAEGAELVGGVTFDVNQGVVYQTSGSLDVVLKKPVGEGYAGHYVDEIRITVAPSLATGFLN